MNPVIMADFQTRITTAWQHDHDLEQATCLERDMLYQLVKALAENECEEIVECGQIAQSVMELPFKRFAI